MSKKKRKKIKALIRLLDDRPEVRVLVEEAAESSPARVRQMMSGGHDGVATWGAPSGASLRDILVRARLAIEVERMKTVRLKKEVHELRAALALERI